MDSKRHGKTIAGVMIVVLCLVALTGCNPSISPETKKVPSNMPSTVSTFLLTPAPTLSPTPAPAPDPTPEPTAKPADYIANTNTGKFHDPACSSVDRMKEHNKLYFTGSREELIALGYAPCKKCDP